MSLFLTHEELVDLTGYKLPAYQRRWLVSRQYRFECDAAGRPKVLRSHVEYRLGAHEGNVARGPQLRLR